MDQVTPDAVSGVTGSLMESSGCVAQCKLLRRRLVCDEEHNCSAKGVPIYLSPRDWGQQKWSWAEETQHTSIIGILHFTMCGSNNDIN